MSAFDDSIEEAGHTNAQLRARIAELEAQLREVAELKKYLDDTRVPTTGKDGQPLSLAGRHMVAIANLGLSYEAQVRTAGAEALEKMGERLRKMLKEGGSSTAWRYCFRQAADECETEARRLRGEGE